MTMSFSQAYSPGPEPAPPVKILCTPGHWHLRIEQAIVHAVGDEEIVILSTAIPTARPSRSMSVSSPHSPVRPKRRFEQFQLPGETSLQRCTRKFQESISEQVGITVKRDTCSAS